MGCCISPSIISI